MNSETNTTESPLVSVVVIGRNESQQIDKTLRSVFAGLSSLESFEVIYVDSASEDDTLERASKYPARIVQLRPDWPLSPSAGRYIGYQHVRGEYLLFLDGDTTLYKSWAPQGLEFLQKNPEYGGVSGLIHEGHVSDEGHCIEVTKNKYRQDASKPFEETITLGGSAMYRKSAMEKSETFNPYLTTGEEGELAIRMRNAGFKLARLSAPIGIKFTEPRQTINEVLRRGRSRLYDYGVTLRYCLRHGGAWQYSYEMIGYFWSFMAFLVVSLAFIACMLWIGQAQWIGVAALAVAAYLLVKKRSLRRIWLSLVTRSVISYRTLVSFFFVKPRAVATYPTDVIEIQ